MNAERRIIVKLHHEKNFWEVIPLGLEELTDVEFVEYALLRLGNENWCFSKQHDTQKCAEKVKKDLHVTTEIDWQST